MQIQVISIRLETLLDFNYLQRYKIAITLFDIFQTNTRQK